MSAPLIKKRVNLGSLSGLASYIWRTKTKQPTRGDSRGRFGRVVSFSCSVFMIPSENRVVGSTDLTADASEEPG